MTSPSCDVSASVGGSQLGEALKLVAPSVACSYRSKAQCVSEQFKPFEKQNRRIDPQPFVILNCRDHRRPQPLGDRLDWHLYVGQLKRRRVRSPKKALRH